MKKHEGHEHRCIIGQYALHHVETPYLLIADQYDTAEICDDALKDKPEGCTESPIDQINMTAEEKLYT